MNQYLKFSPFYFFCLYTITAIFFGFCANYILYDETLYYKSFENTLEIKRIAQMIEQQRIFQKIGYAIIPVLLLFRVFYTAICLAIGAFILELNLKFSHCFNIAIKADVIFLIGLIVKINYFSLIPANSLQEINNPVFSILHLVGSNSVEQWLSYPLGLLNIFELIYLILLALFISSYTKKSFGSSFGFVVKTYGIGILLWVVFIVYIILFLF